MKKTIQQTVTRTVEVCDVPGCDKQAVFAWPCFSCGRALCPDHVEYFVAVTWGDSPSNRLCAECSSLYPGVDLIAPFDSLLRDDPSDANLLIWADALEDAGDEACRGVREFLVGQKRRPRRIIGAVSWWGYEVNENDGSDIGDVMQRLAFSSDDYDNACYYPMYLLGPHYYTIAIYDAAQAWCELNPPKDRRAA